MFLLVWRNFTRRPQQSLITVLVVTFAIAMFVVAHLVFSLLQQSVSLASERLGADVIVFPQGMGVTPQQTIFTAEPVNVYMHRDLVEHIAQLPNVKRVTPQFFTQSLDESCCDLREAKRLIGYDPASDFIVHPWLKNQDIQKLADDQILIGGVVKPFFGNRAIILDGIFTVAGKLELTGTGMDDTVFLPIDVARRLAKESPYLQGLWKEYPPEALVSVVMLQTEPGSLPLLVAREINNSGLPVQAVAAGEIIRGMRQQMQSFAVVLVWIWAGIALSTGVALLGRFLSLARERKREIGVMRALGGQRSDVSQLILGEVACGVVAGWFLGSLLGTVGALYALEWLKGALVIPPWHIDVVTMLGSSGVAFIMAIIIGAFSALYPTWRASRLDPQEAISRGDLD